MKTTQLPAALLTGFAPFDGETVNPSLEIARALDGEIIAGHRVIAAELPTEFAASLPALDGLLERHRPALVLALGQAGGGGEIALERVAINLIDARIADNAGNQPIDIHIVENAPNAYFSTLPLKAMLASLRDLHIPAALSHSAGTFVCNQVFFHLMHRLAASETRGGFVHVPWLPQQAARFANAPSMPLETMLAAVRALLSTAATTHADAHYAAGSLH